MTDQELALRFPAIAWREPIRVGIIGYMREKWACRFCIAHFGLRAREHERLWDTREDAATHIAAAHPVGTGG